MESCEIIQDIPFHLIPPPLPTVGEQKVGVFLVNFTHDKTYPLSMEAARSLVFSTLNSFILENSYGKTWLTGDILGWYTIPFDVMKCNLLTINEEVHAIASREGVDLSSFIRFVYLFPFQLCVVIPGSATVGGNPTRMWVNGGFNIRTLGHEFGHNLGLSHSFSYKNGVYRDYGDTLDIMGYPGVIGHYSSPHKERLGWIKEGAEILIVDKDGEYPLASYSQSTFPEFPKVLKILKSNVNGAKTYYYLEARRPIGWDTYLFSNTNVSTGVVFHVGDPLHPSTLLDLTPETSSFLDPALTVGKTYVDKEAGITITTKTADLDGAVVNVSFDSTPPILPATQPITIEVTKLSYVSEIITTVDTKAPQIRVVFTLTKPDAQILRTVVTSNREGKAVWKFTLPKNSIKGEYKLSAFTPKETVETSFFAGN